MTGFGRTQVGHWMTLCPAVVDAAESIDRAERIMAEEGVRHLPVVSAGRTVGVVSDRDIAQVRALSDARALAPGVAEAMTPVAYAVRAGSSLAAVAKRMAAEKYGCAVVTADDDEGLVGIFTAVDALHALSALIGPDSCE